MKNSFDINDKFQFNETNYYKLETDKKRIMLCSTNRLTHNSKGDIDFTFFNSSKTREGGENKKTPMYSIDINGIVYCHFPDKYYSDIVDEEYRPQEIISIQLHNEGFLNFNNSKLSYVIWDGKKSNTLNPINIEWRGEYYWSPYTEAQYSSLKLLIGVLCEKYDIPEKFINTNTLDTGSYIFSGIISRANLNPFYLDLNPTFDWTKFLEL